VGRPGTLLGVVANPVLHQTPVDLTAGDSMIFYTDGLIEARLAGDVLFDLDYLIGALQGCRGLDPAGITAHIEQTLTDLRAEPRDDIAILVVQVSGDRPGDASASAGYSSPAASIASAGSE
jgi:serine phosphatase RsbU (regulator of sigma subunit)